MDRLELNLAQRVNIGDSLTRAAWRYPRKTAIVDGGRRFSYQEFLDLVNRFANGLLVLGYGRGTPLALMAGNSAEFLFTYYACAKIGAICVPINLGWKPHEVAYVLQHSKARGIVVESQLLPALSSSLADIAPQLQLIIVGGSDGEEGGQGEFSGPSFAQVTALGTEEEPEVYVEDRDAVSYLYTSGTTSAPKGVVSSHLAVYLESLGVAVEDKFVPDDVVGAMMPLFHTAQLNGQCTPAVIVGATMVLLRGFQSEMLLRAIEGEGLTMIFGLPFMFREMLEDPQVGVVDLSSLRLAIYAMAPMPDAILRRCLDVFKCDFTLGFGQTELNPVTTVFRPEHQLSHSGAVGTPQVNVLVGVVDDEGNLLPSGASGEIVYRSPQAMTEYLANPQATEEAFRGGWFHSGDVGYFDKDGILWFEDRFKDVIKSGGENVSSIEIEKAIFAVEPGVAEVVVVGLPHARWGEAITAFVVPKAGVTIDSADLKEKVGQILDGFKTPKAVVVLEGMPRTSTGKVQKNLVREGYRSYYGE